MKRILIIEPNWLGDVLFTTPAIRAIKQKHPNSHVSVMVHARCRTIVEGNPNIDEIIVPEKIRGVEGLFARLKLLPYLKEKKFDMAFLFSRSMSHAFICVLAGIKERIGYFRLKRALFLTHKVKLAKTEPHRVEYFLNIARHVGIDTDNKDYEFFTAEKDNLQAQSMLSENNICGVLSYFVINPGGNWMPKRWPKKEFAKLADALFEKYNTKVIITGAEKDIKLGEQIKSSCKTNPVNLCGKTTLKQLGVILMNARMVVSNDSGPMHIAVSQKAPTIALFGPTHPEITGPYGNSRYIVVKKDTECTVPCYVRNCKNYHCMDAITVADVMEAAEELLRARK